MRRCSLVGVNSRMQNPSSASNLLGLHLAVLTPHCWVAFFTYAICKRQNRLGEALKYRLTSKGE